MHPNTMNFSSWTDRGPEICSDAPAQPVSAHSLAGFLRTILMPPTASFQKPVAGDPETHSDAPAP